MDEERIAGSPGRPVFRYALILAAAAFCLRSCALSPGPDVTTRYHPDVAKQVRAVQQFLAGDYLVITHRRNYDGYPLFNSHTVEYLVRAVNPAVQAALRHVGVVGREAPPGLPGVSAIFWATLLWNALMSAAAAGVAVVLGWRFGPLAGILAGLLAAISPLDTAAAHYASGDTAAAFFALLAVYLAVRIQETGRVRYYALGALATAAAFSSKYNAGAAGAALAVAHFARHPGSKALLSPAAGRRLVAAAGAGVLGILLTSPALLVNAPWTIASIRKFMAFVASYHLPEVEAARPLGERLLLGWRNNAQLLARSTGLLVWGGAAAALALARPRATMWVIASLPLAHLLVGFSAKPFAHPVHHLPVVLPLLILAAAGMAALAARGRPLPVRALGALLAAGGILWLASATRDELFFFSRGDTRQVAETWARESLPPTVLIAAGRTFREPPRANAPPQGLVSFVSREPRPSPPPGAFRLARFFVEEHSLPVFRNPVIDVLALTPALLAPDFSLPLWQPLPSARSATLVFVDAPAFYRSPLVRDLSEGEPFAATAVSRRPLRRAWLVLQGGGTPCGLAVSFGGRASERVLDAAELAVIPVEDPAPLRPAHEGGHFYEWRARARFGTARVSLVTDEATLGRHLFNAGRFAEASRALAAPGTGTGSPGRLLELAIAGRASGAMSAAEAEAIAKDLLAVPVWDREEIRRRFGIHPDWLDGLPYLTLTEADFSPTTSPRDAGPEGADAAPAELPAVFGTRRFTLEPGRYRVAVSLACQGGPFEIVVRDACGGVIRRIAAAPPAAPTPPGSADATREFALEVEGSRTSWSLEIAAAPRGGIPAGLTVSVRPDVLATVAGRVGLLRRLLGREASGSPGRLDYEALLSAGDAARVRGEHGLAGELYRQAAAAAPDRPGARERLAGGSVPPRRPIGARFSGGVELLSFAIDPSDSRPGGSVGVRLEWRLPADLERPDRIAVWFHALDGGGKTLFQWDRPLLAGACSSPEDDRVQPRFARIPIPPGVPPGSYELRAGLWLPSRETRVRVLEAAVPHDHRSLSLGTVAVAAPPEGRQPPADSGTR
jgi:hypothetical protein